MGILRGTCPFSLKLHGSIMGAPFHPYYMTTMKASWESQEPFKSLTGTPGNPRGMVMETLGASFIEIILGHFLGKLYPAQIIRWYVLVFGCTVGSLL